MDPAGADLQAPWRKKRLRVRRVFFPVIIETRTRHSIEKKTSGTNNGYAIMTRNATIRTPSYSDVYSAM